MSLRRVAWGVAVALAIGVPSAGFPSSSGASAVSLRPGEFCSLAKESYYEANGYTCHMAPDGRNRLYTDRVSPPTPTPSPTPSPPLRLGSSISFQPATRSSRCHLRHNSELPDRACSPGAYYSGATRSAICRSGYAHNVRNVSEATKAAVYVEYGIRQHSAASYEVDHLVPLELGGSNARANLFPEAATPKPGFHEKDRLENWAHARLCAGSMGLRTVQREFAQDWLALFNVAF
jgi:hypothetical protein